MSIYNTTNPTNFLMHIDDGNLTKTIKLHVQSYKPPVLSIPTVNVPNSMLGKGRAYLPGTTFQYKPFSVSVLVDRDLVAWLEVYQWALAVMNYQSYQNKAFEDITSSIEMHILDNRKENTVLIHEFTQPFPSNIYPPTYNHTAGSDYPMVMNIDIAYQTFNVRDKDGELIEPRKEVHESRNELINELEEDYITFERINKAHK